MANEKIMLAHGGGGRLSNELIQKYILPRFNNSTLAAMTDAAEIKIGEQIICFTTDSYVVKPLFFNGGDIGTLAVCGTINDLAVSGAEPVAMSLALIIEEGLDFAVLNNILDSIAKTAKTENVEIVCGDTKTVGTGAADKIFINTAGVGKKLPNANLAFNRIQQGDKIIVSGTIGDHGMTVMSQREGMKFESDLKSDCGSVAQICRTAIKNYGENIKFMRDPTRGGLAATLNEIANSANINIEINEQNIPVNPTVQAAADMLGFDVLNIANEGKVVIIVSENKAQNCLDMCKKTETGKDAVIIGQICKADNEPTVEMITKIGGKRIIQMPYGRNLPRIC